jgi:hypothetical protein
MSANHTGAARSPYRLRSSGSARGQIFSAELIVSVGLFVSALLLFLFVWNSMIKGYVEEDRDAKMAVPLIGISDMAVLSPGDPSNWETQSSGNVYAYGLASSPNVLSSRKLFAMEQLFASNYDSARQTLGAGPYNVYAEVDSLSGVPLYNFGLKPDMSSSSISTLSTQRVATLDSASGEPVTFTLQVWRIKGE